MRTLILAAVCAGVLASSGMSEAAQISSAAIFGGHFQTWGRMRRPQRRDQADGDDDQDPERQWRDGGDV